MQAQVYEGYFHKGEFYTAGKTITFPERKRIFVTVLDEQQAQYATMNEHLAAMDEFINAIKTSDEDIPEFERIALREVDI